MAYGSSYLSDINIVFVQVPKKTEPKAKDYLLTFSWKVQSQGMKSEGKGELIKGRREIKYKRVHYWDGQTPYQVHFSCSLLEAIAIETICCVFQNSPGGGGWVRGIEVGERLTHLPSGSLCLSSSGVWSPPSGVVAFLSVVSPSPSRLPWRGQNAHGSTLASAQVWSPLLVSWHHTQGLLIVDLVAAARF